MWDAQGGNNTVNKLLKKGYWPSLVTGGTTNPALLSSMEELTKRSGYLSKETFDSIMMSTPGSKPGKPSQLLKLGILSKTNTAPEVDVSEADRWRIVSFRFDPCPNALIKDSSKTVQGGESILNQPALPGANVCKPDIRLVAQPVVGLRSIQESVFGSALPKISATKRVRTESQANSFSNGWLFADYGIHLFFGLDPTQAKTFIAELAQIKERHAALCNTSGLPLMVHPCLSRATMAEVPWSDLERSKKAIQFTSKVPLTA